MKSLNFFAGVLVFVPFLITACVTPPKGIATVKGTEQEDIPVPRDFEFKESESPDLRGLAEEARFRSWRGYYRGNGHIGDIASWYIGEMRQHGWQFKSRSEQVEKRKLSFEKLEEISEIQIYRELDSSAGGYVTMVRAEIHPRGPEDLTVDEHLRSGKEPEIKPASFSTKEVPASLKPAADTEVEGSALEPQSSSSAASEILPAGDAAGLKKTKKAGRTSGKK